MQKLANNIVAPHLDSWGYFITSISDVMRLFVIQGNTVMEVLWSIILFSPFFLWSILLSNEPFRCFSYQWLWVKNQKNLSYICCPMEVLQDRLLHPWCLQTVFMDGQKRFLEQPFGWMFDYWYDSDRLPLEVFQLHQLHLWNWYNLRDWRMF